MVDEEYVCVFFVLVLVSFRVCLYLVDFCFELCCFYVLCELFVVVC